MLTKSCAMCVKRHETSAGDLECRALPPVQDVGRFARYPLVRPDDYCHDAFKPEDPGMTKSEGQPRARHARSDDRKGSPE